MVSAATRRPGDRLRDAFWERHANPWSGATRFAITPTLLYAIYRRNWGLLGTTLVFTAVNPVLFPRPERTDNWFSRAVLAERAWLEAGNGTVSLDYPNVLNALNVVAALYALSSAIRRKPVGTVLGGAAVVGLKALWVDEIIALTGGGENGGESGGDGSGA